MQKCDVIIPIYKSPDWVKLCVYALFRNTKEETLNKVFLINDCDDELTNQCLENLKEKYEKIVILKNEKNLGFVKSTNRGLKESQVDYALLLNTDCLLSKNAIEKMIKNMESDEKIGLICPISSNAANLTLDMFPGFNYNDMNKLLEKKFIGKIFDACTIVGNCLLITKKCLEKTGYLDEAYGLGYGEETDYQFSAMKNGFKAKVAIDTYVYHKSEVSFGTSKEKKERLQKNRDLFFSRWKKEYEQEMKKYEKNDPIKYILDNISDKEKIPNVDTAIYLNGIVQNAGGVHVSIDLANFLAINNESANIIYDTMGVYKEIMLFNPISSNKLSEIKINKLVATIWSSIFEAQKIANEKKCKLVYFVQGYEGFFENGSIYGIVESSYKIPDSILTISNYLKNELKNTHNVEANLINNGVHYDLIHKKRSNKQVKTVTFILRNNVMKGDWVILDIIKKIDNQLANLNINVVYMNEYLEFPKLKNNQLNKYLGPLSRSEIFNLLQNSDIYVDASLNEGFGLAPLEAMTAGNVVVASNSFGVNDYLKNEKNGFIISEVNDSQKYVDKITYLTKKASEFRKIREEAMNTAKQFDYDMIVPKYIDYFKKVVFKKKKELFTEEEKRIIKAMTKSNEISKEAKRKIFVLAKIIPKGIKNKMKKVITFLYNCYGHN